MANQLTALCAVASFLWLTHNLEDHQIIEQPRLSSFLVLVIAALSSYLASFCAVWLPGNNGRFDDELGPLKVTRPNQPKKPRRYFLPGLIICLVSRLEIFYRVTFDLQCSKAGIEAFLPLLMLLYELLPGRRMRPRAGGGDGGEEKDPDDPGTTLYEAVGGWFTDSKASLSIAVVLLTVGAYLASSQEIRSTFLCASHDRSALVIFLQWTGAILDAAIAIMLWRILAWPRTTKSRLRTLSGILSVSSLAVGLLNWTSRFGFSTRPATIHLGGPDPLYIFDVVVDGLVFSVFLVAGSLLTADGSPLSLAGILTFLLGLLLAVQKTVLSGTWENTSPAVTYFALLFLCVGFSFFVYANNIRSVVCLHRAFVVFLLVLLTVVAAIYTPVKALKPVGSNHPLSKVIYEARIEADRWLRHAAVSSSLPVAVQEYRERHGGRDPPPGFDIWYGFAKDRRSAILDHFPQMENDLLPFWGMPPSKIREDVRRAAAEPDMAMLQIKGRKAQHNLPPANPYKPVMDDLVDLVGGFVDHLPDMELAINLDERPRVLAPWADVVRTTKAAQRKRASKLLPRLAPALDEMPAAQPAVLDKLLAQKTFTPVKELREMTALTCPPGTKARAATHWDIRDLCSSCAKPQSQGQFLTNWTLAQEICHQSDLLRQHGFYMTPPELRPLQELLPVFSRAKTDSYRDILLPLRHIMEPAEPGTQQAFDMKSKKLFWRGKVDRLRSSHELVRGGHRERLVHLLSAPARSERTTLLLPSRKGWAYEQVPTGQLNDLLALDVAFASYSACKAADKDKDKDAGAGGRNCDHAGNNMFPQKPDYVDPLRHQYVMVVDTDSGPPREFLRTLRSSSVPFHASIFAEWYSERLMPWVHFVPVDLRFHALHSTLTYFVGLPKKYGRRMNGREVEMAARQEDGRWIAEEGKRWAEKALRREDREVYLFRLLLEWARVVDDNRDEIGFVLS
ncbi:glycosyltransferase family 90 protein [Chaetomium strumarium]|uniref:Glycosyltransferase family 90 protein n=1 Tax=Chaetomium strumarium TaxID=1170767 RepID=A0AAJ0H2C8_9PEZI|nr:glycosyltransferase family 90 protein [Chaetomium strumarium]